MTVKYDKLIERVAKLAKQNKELKEAIRRLQKENERLNKKDEQNFRHSQALLPDELKPDTTVKSEKVSLKFNMATVLFADIYGFSNVLTTEDSGEYMDELDTVLYKFDEIIAKYKIIKIKTIGDSYMCAGGIPIKNITNPVEVVKAAIEMKSFLEGFEKEKRGDGKRIWDMKIGIHTGPVTAAVGGKRKATYDIKGDTVNIASRIETVSDNSHILISIMTYELVKDFFQCEYFGKLPVKYKNDLEIYETMGLNLKLSADSLGILPNKKFNIKFGLRQFNDIQEIMLDRLEKELPDFLFYHNVKHTVDVVTGVELMGWAEGCTDEEVLLLKMAGLFHDAGHISSYDDHEYQGTQLVKQYLPEYHYTDEQIEIICEIIMATKLPPQPKTLLQKIICDADLDYLGRSDFIPVSNTLYEELKAQNKIACLNDWNKIQVKFISGHQYFTKTAMSLREVNKQIQIDRIQSLISE